MRKRIVAAVAAVACVAALGLAGCGGSGAANSSASGSAAGGEGASASGAEAAQVADPVASLPTPDFASVVGGTESEIKQAMDGFYSIEGQNSSGHSVLLYSNSKAFIDSVEGVGESNIREGMRNSGAADGDWAVMYIAAPDYPATLYLHVSGSQVSKDGFSALAKQYFDIDETHEAYDSTSSAPHAYFTIKGNSHVYGEYFLNTYDDSIMQVTLSYSDSLSQDWASIVQNR